jgi:DNA-binding response OmpR family regulator
MKKRIVILSDDVYLSHSLSLFLENEFEVEAVDHYSKAIEVVSTHKTDLLLVDYGLPGKEISRIIDAIRSSDKKLPIVSMYVYHEKSKRADSDLKRCCDAVFYKPVNILDVLGRIRVLLS